MKDRSASLQRPSRRLYDGPHQALKGGSTAPRVAVLDFDDVTWVERAQGREGPRPEDVFVERPGRD